jgi:hypothetical protein
MPGMRRGPGLVGMAARTAVVAGTATAVSGKVARKQQQKAINEQQAAAAQQAPAAPADPSSDDSLIEIQKLSVLHEQGVLTDEEFSAKKAQLLGL